MTFDTGEPDPWMKMFLGIIPDCWEEIMKIARMRPLSKLFAFLWTVIICNGLIPWFIYWVIEKWEDTKEPQTFVSKYTLPAVVLMLNISWVSYIIYDAKFK